VTTPRTAPRLGRIGAWFNPRYDDDTRTDFVVEAESLGFPTAWLGFGRASISDLALVERVLDATATITVATAIVNMWTNDPAEIAGAYHHIASRHGDRFLLGIGVGHPESITTYHAPYAASRIHEEPSAGSSQHRPGTFHDHGAWTSVTSPPPTPNKCSTVRIQYCGIRRACQGSGSGTADLR
jgi:hypothetical protein